MTANIPNSNVKKSIVLNYHTVGFQIADKDGDGDINYMEFMRLMRR